MRRLPVFFVLDVSESMAGDNLRNMEEAMQRVVAALRQYPHALDTVYISVIAFAGIARTIAPLVDLGSFYPPKLPIGSGTNLGAALRHLMSEIERSVQKSTVDQKGDWRPIVYLITDGKPTDETNSTIDKWNVWYRKRLDLVAIGLGRFADLRVLTTITDHVLVFEGASDADFTRFIQWVTASVTEQSRSVGDSEMKGVRLAKIDDAILTKISKETAPASVDHDCVVLAGRCQKSRAPYLMKYDRGEPNAFHTKEFAIDLSRYVLSGCYQVEESYFDWSDPAGMHEKVSTMALQGAPGCPYCGNPSAFAQCGCGRLMCVSGPGPAVCPWCGSTTEFVAPRGDEGGFDIDRGMG